MSDSPQPDWNTITRLIEKAHPGDKTALDILFPLIYPELRRLAEACIRRERPDHTLQGTALVHEAYLRLRAQSLPDVQDRMHFLKLAARVMRQVLVDHARRRNVAKRSAAMQVPLEEGLEASTARPEWMLELDDALHELDGRDPLKARLIELRFFTGLTAEESADALGMDVAVIRRELRLAQAWLGRKLQRLNSSSSREARESNPS
jgi:RNA polymerase sigma factor (TIGR02999 family)